MDKKTVKKFVSQNTYKRVNQKIKYLGNSASIPINLFLGLRIIICFIIFIYILLFVKMGYFFAPLFTIIFYFGSEYLLFDLKIKSRSDKLDREGLFFFEVLSLTLENGRSLKNALKLTCDSVNSEISTEFNQTLKEVEMGKSLEEALKDMRKRIPSRNINSVITNMTQSAFLGTNISDSLFNQTEFLREKRLMEVKGKIQKMPIKVSIVSVLFYIPLLLLLVLGPLLLSLY